MTNTLIYDSMAQNSIVLQKDIFRLSALLYAETTNTFSSVDVQLHIVKCIITQNNNEFMSSEEIISKILELYKYSLSEEELEKILGQPRIFETSQIDRCKVYRLLQREYEKTNQYLSKNIDHYISQFIYINQIKEADLYRESVYKYLYELTTTNINSYKILLSQSDGSNLTDSELSVNAYDLSDVERKFVHDFVEWDNPEKNAALSNIVLCCLEYCLLVSGDKPNSLITKAIRNREIYLDTNIIFRVLGINGISRQNVVVAFLRKCNQAKVKIIVSGITKKEFWDTVDYHISQIVEFPRGKVFKGAYESLSDYNLYSFYDEWYKSHENLSLKYFKKYIQSLYAEFISRYKVHEEESALTELLRSTEFLNERERYARNILNVKRDLKSYYIPDDCYISDKAKHDASMVRYIELYRSGHLEDKDVFFVSSDKALRFWDMTRGDSEYPVIIYPSQLYLVLIKICGRSENDLRSFVSFINIRPRSQQLTPEKANIILSGISSITEDIKTQAYLVSSVFDEEFQNIIKHSNTDQELYQQTQMYSQRYLEAELKSKEDDFQNLLNDRDLKVDKIAELTDIIQEKDASIKEINDKRMKADEEIIRKSSELEAYKERICNFAEKKIYPRFLLRWYILPAIIILYTLFVVFFITLQFIFCKASWNFVSNLLDTIGDTTFGQGVQDYIYVVDFVLAASFGFLYRRIWKNPWDRAKMEEDKAVRIEKYIKNNNLSEEIH